MPIWRHAPSGITDAMYSPICFASGPIAHSFFFFFLWSLLTKTDVLRSSLANLFLWNNNLRKKIRLQQTIWVSTWNRIVDFESDVDVAHVNQTIAVCTRHIFVKLNKKPKISWSQTANECKPVRWRSLRIERPPPRRRPSSRASSTREHRAAIRWWVPRPTECDSTETTATSSKVSNELSVDENFKRRVVHVESATKTPERMLNWETNHTMPKKRKKYHKNGFSSFKRHVQASTRTEPARPSLTALRMLAPTNRQFAKNDCLNSSLAYGASPTVFE